MGLLRWTVRSDLFVWTRKLYQDAMGRLSLSILVHHYHHFKRSFRPSDLVTTGISRAYGGVLSALSIRYTLTPVLGEGEEDGKRWQEREEISAVYEDRREVLVVDEREVVGDFGGQ